MVSVANINDVLEGHVALEVECVDRLYLNAYVPNLQVGGQVELTLTIALITAIGGLASVETTHGRWAIAGALVLGLPAGVETRWRERHGRDCDQSREL
jgi:hypothetical protein